MDREPSAGIGVGTTVFWPSSGPSVGWAKNCGGCRDAAAGGRAQDWLMPRALLTSSLAATALVLATAGSASAAETLSLSGPSSAAVGQPVVIQASGNDNPADGTLYLELDSI